MSLLFRGERSLRLGGVRPLLLWSLRVLSDLSDRAANLLTSFISLTPFHEPGELLQFLFLLLEIVLIVLDVTKRLSDFTSLPLWHDWDLSLPFLLPPDLWLSSPSSRAWSSCSSLLVSATSFCFACGGFFRPLEVVFLYLDRPLLVS